jgi:hypothetical protein
MQTVTSWPLIPGDWKALNDQESAQFVERLAAVASRTQGADAFTRQHPVSGLRALPLSFYPGWLVVEGEARLSGDEIGTFDVLFGPRFMWLIDGHSGVINALNAGRLPLPTMDGDNASLAAGDAAIDRLGRSQPGVTRFLPSPLAKLEPATTAADYLRFYCASVWGERGPFRLIESEGALDPADAQAIDGSWRDNARPLELQKAAKGIEGDTLVLYGGALFSARFRLANNGSVRMLNDKPLASGVPTLRHQPPFRDVRPAGAGDVGTGRAVA